MTFFHIGFPKSASTTLQKQLFDKHSQINFLGCYPTANIGQDTTEVNKNSLFLSNKLLREFHHSLTNLEGIEYTFSNVQKHAGEVSKLLSDKKVNVFSNERFASVLFTHKDRAEKARRIKEFYPDTKIIIILRKQIDIIKSQYRDHPFDPRNLYSNKKSVSLNEWVELDFKNNEISFVKSIEYYKLVEYYSTLFGKNNVGVFLFEELVQDVESFAKKISNFLDVDEVEALALLNSKHENEGTAHNLNRYRKFRVLIFNLVPDVIKYSNLIKNIDRKLFSIFKKGKKQKVEMGIKTKRTIYDYYRQGNKKLEVEYDIELTKYGYFDE